MIPAPNDWVINVRTQNRDFVRSALKSNKKTLISSSFDADIVLRKLEKTGTELKVHWRNIPSERALKQQNEKGAAQDEDSVEGEEQSRCVPYVKIKTQSDELTVDGEPYSKPFVIEDDIAVIAVGDLTLVISTQAKFEAYANPRKKAAAGKLTKGTTESAFVKLFDSSKWGGLIKSNKVQAFVRNLHPAVVITCSVATFGLFLGVGYLTYVYSEDNRQLRDKVIDDPFVKGPPQKLIKERHNDVSSYFYEILAYYPNLHLKIEVNKEENSALVRGYSSSEDQAERFKRSLGNDLDIDLTFRIHSVESLGNMINKSLSRTQVGDISLVYVEGGNLTCITSTVDAKQQPIIEAQINQSAAYLGYPKKIKCKKVLFSKDEISFVSNSDYPFVKLKNGNVFFKGSEIGPGIFLKKIDDDKLTFRFKETTFYMSLR